MMNRPVVKAEILSFMRERQTQPTGELASVLQAAKENHIPVIPQETVNYFQLLLSLLQPESILEIGTANGFSALVMAKAVPTTQITTIDRNPEMIAMAKENFKDFDHHHQIELLEGEASEVLTKLSEPFDFIFMDSAKSKYIEFLPEAVRLLKENGVILFDDIFQAGEILLPISEIKWTQRALERGLRRLFDEVLDNSNYLTSILPLGDGLLMIKKSKSFDCFQK